MINNERKYFRSNIGMKMNGDQCKKVNRKFFVVMQKYDRI
jgi:hypothetical protein